VEVVASLSQGRTAAAQCGLFTHKSVPVIFEPPFTNTQIQNIKQTKQKQYGEKKQYEKVLGQKP